MNLEGVRAIRLLAGVGEVERVRGKKGPGGDVSGAGPATNASTTGTTNLQSYLAAANALPRVRADRVEALRAAIERGTYEIPVDQVAKGLTGDGS